MWLSWRRSAGGGRMKDDGPTGGVLRLGGRTRTHNPKLDFLFLDFIFIPKL